MMPVSFIRYSRLFLHFVRFSLSRSMEFRVDFWLRVVMDTAFYAGEFLFFHIIYSHTEALGGLKQEDIYVFIAIFLVVDGLYMTFLSNNMWDFPNKVNRGDLDYYLVRPVSPMFFLMLREFAVNSFLNLLIALGILAWAISNHSISFSSFDFVILFFVVLNGFFVNAAFSLAFALPVVWTQSGEGLRVLSFTLQRFMERPDRIFPGALRIMLITVLPLGLMVSFPTQIFLNHGSSGLETHFFVVSFAFIALVGFFWKRGLRAYNSASS